MTGRVFFRLFFDRILPDRFDTVLPPRLPLPLSLEPLTGQETMSVDYLGIQPLDPLRETLESKKGVLFRVALRHAAAVLLLGACPRIRTEAKTWKFEVRFWLV